MFGINLNEIIGIVAITFLFGGLFLFATRPIAKWYTGNNEIILLLKEIKDQMKDK